MEYLLSLERAYHELTNAGQAPDTRLEDSARILEMLKGLQGLIDKERERRGFSPNP